MEIGLVILTIGLLVFIAHLFSSLFEKTRIPDVLLLMLIGIGLGPVAGMIGPEDFGRIGNVMTTIALIVILFEGGTTLNVSSMKQALLPMTFLTLSTFAVTAGICFGVTYLVFGLTLYPSLLVGTILGGTSSAVVIPMIRSLRVKEPVYGTLMLESALTDVLCIVFTFVTIQTAMQSEGLGAAQIAISVSKTLILAALIGMAGGIVWMFLLKWVRVFPNNMFTTLAFIFILFGLAELAGLSGAIAALSFGITLGNLPERKNSETPEGLVFLRINEQEKNFFSEFVFLLKTFFFLYLGISIRFDSYLVYLVGSVIVIIVFIARIPLTWISFPRSCLRSDVVIAALMVPKGLAAAVLAGMPLQAGVPGSEGIQALVFAVVLISIILTAVLIPVANHIPPYRVLFRNFAQEEGSKGDDRVGEDPVHGKGNN